MPGEQRLSALVAREYGDRQRSVEATQSVVDFLQKNEKLFRFFIPDVSRPHAYVDRPGVNLLHGVSKSVEALIDMPDFRREREQFMDDILEISYGLNVYGAAAAEIMMEHALDLAEVGEYREHAAHMYGHAGSICRMQMERHNNDPDKLRDWAIRSIFVNTMAAQWSKKADKQYAYFGFRHAAFAGKTGYRATGDPEFLDAWRDNMIIVAQRYGKFDRDFLPQALSHAGQSTYERTQLNDGLSRKEEIAILTEANQWYGKAASQSILDPQDVSKSVDYIAKKMGRRRKNLERMQELHAQTDMRSTHGAQAAMEEIRIAELYLKTWETHGVGQARFLAHLDRADKMAYSLPIPNREVLARLHELRDVA